MLIFFTIYETLFVNVITLLLITYQNKTKMPGKKKEVPGLFIRTGELYQLYTSYLSINFGGTVKSLSLKWILLFI